MILFIKAIRAIWSHKRAYLACILLVMIGVFMFTCMGTMAQVMSEAANRYYQDYRLADVFAKVRALPDSAIADLERIEGISEAMGRRVYDARALMAGDDNLVTLRIISVDPSYPGTAINSIMKKGGDFNRSMDIMPGEDFLAAHHLQIGDNVRVIIEKKEYELTICATAENPEYVYPIKDATEILPDMKTFGFSFMPQEGLWTLTGQHGLYNEVCFTLEEGYTFDDVRLALEDRLTAYGLTDLFERADHPGVAMVDMELNSIGTISKVMPMVFMMMAVLVLYLMLKRLIEQERVQIGVMKAFGYSNNVILLHYMFYGAATGAAGGLMGLLMASGAFGTYLSLFMEYFKMPIKINSIPISTMAQGLGIGVVTGSLGGYFGARRALMLNPAEAMRPETPMVMTRDIAGKLPFLQWILNTGGHMAIRSIERSKMRSAVIVLGIVFAFGLMTFMGSYNLMIDFMMLNQFSKIQRYDAKLTFYEPMDYIAATEAVYSINGVTRAEGILELPVELKNKNRRSGVFLTGLVQDSRLYAIYDNNAAVTYPPPTTGIIINNGLAGKLDVKKGDWVYLSSPLLEEDIKLTITAVAEQNLGLSAYMELDALCGVFGLSREVSSVVLTTGDMAAVKSLSDEAGALSVIEDKASAYQNSVAMMAPYSVLIYLLWVMSVVVAFAIIYNTATISLSERKREYATLRVMGMQVKEVGAIMGFEYWLLCTVGILLGIPFNMFLKETLATFFTSDGFTFPVLTPLSAYAQAAAGCVIAVLWANHSSLKQIRQFDMVEVLKERE